MSDQAASSYVHHQFDSYDQQVEAGTLGMWFFLVTEVLFFGGLFFAYIVYRNQYPEAFLQLSQMLDWRMGCLNTFVLLTSSFTMVLAVHHGKLGNRKPTMFYLFVTIALAAVFMVVKFFEWKAKYEHGVMIGPLWTYEGPNANRLHLAYCLYFFMTGLHGIHVLIGMAVLSWVFVLAAKGQIHQYRYLPIDLTGLYWHLVDLIWVFLFPLYYLMAQISFSGGAH